MARKINKSVEVGLPNTPFGQHSFYNMNKQLTEIRSAHKKNPYRNERKGKDGTTISVLMPNVSNDFVNIFTRRLMDKCIRKNSTAFFEDPYSAVMDFDEGYEKISLAVMESGSKYTYRCLFTGQPIENDTREKAKWPINTFIIDGEKFGRKKLHEIQRVNEKSYQVVLNIGDYIVISCMNRAHRGICGMLAFLYRVDEFTQINSDAQIKTRLDSVEGKRPEYSYEDVNITYDVANCSLASVFAYHLGGQPASSSDDEYISEVNDKKFNGEIIDWVKENFDGLQNYSTDDLNNLEMGKNMFVYPVAARSKIDDWTVKAFEAINCLKHQGHEGGAIFDDDEITLTEEQLNEEMDWVPIDIKGKENLYDQMPITYFSKFYVGENVDRLRKEAAESTFRNDKKKLLRRDFIYNCKATIMVDAECKDGKISITFSFPSIYSQHVGTYTFELDPQIHMSDQYSNVFFHNICKKIEGEGDALPTYEIVLEEGKTDSKYVSILLTYTKNEEVVEAPVKPKKKAPAKKKS